jgi:hypothetical protein
LVTRWDQRFGEADDFLLDVLRAEPAFRAAVFFGVVLRAVLRVAVLREGAFFRAPAIVNSKINFEINIKSFQAKNGDRLDPFLDALLAAMREPARREGVVHGARTSDSRAFPHWFN